MALVISISLLIVILIVILPGWILWKMALIWDETDDRINHD